MKSKYLISALLVAGLAAVAHAATPSIGDLVIGAQGGGQSANDFEFDAGNLASLVAATNSTSNHQTELSTDVTAGLIATFGAGWATSGATIGAAETLGSGGSFTSDVTQADGVSTGVANLTAVTTTSAGITSVDNVGGSAEVSAYKDSKTSAIYSNRSTKIQTLYSGPGLTSPGSVVIPAGNADSWSIFANNTGNGFSAPLDKNTGLSLGSGQFEVIDLFQYLNSDTAAGTYIGSIELGSDGSLWFATAAIPEPSTYAAILGVASLAFVAIRRRKQQMLA
jgi:hypothetical protein